MSKTASPNDRRGGRRLAAVACPVIAGALLLAACGSGSDEGATQSTIQLSQGSTAFIVRAPATTLAPEATPAEGGISTAAQDYTVQAGDYPLKIVADFGITLDELVAFNEWASYKEFPGIGSVIKIPPNAILGGAGTTTTIAGATAGGETASGTETATPAATLPDSGDNCGVGEHIVKDGDLPIRLAKQYDVTLEALNAANASNPAYRQFIIGQTIYIPSKTDC